MYVHIMLVKHCLFYFFVWQCAAPLKAITCDKLHGICVKWHSLQSAYILVFYDAIKRPPHGHKGKHTNTLAIIADSATDRPKATQ